MAIEGSTLVRSRPVPESHTLPARVLVVVALVVGVMLGALGFVVDEVSLPGGRLLIVVLSTGLSWGAAAVVLGMLARNAGAAAVAGLLALLSAVVAYYGGIGLLGLRPSADVPALMTAGVIWGLAGAIGGPLAGVAGWHARFGGRKARSIAWGVISGLLLGQGLRWAWRYGLTPDPVFTSALVFPLALFAWGIRRGAWAFGLPALIVTAAASFAAWSLLDRAV